MTNASKVINVEALEAGQSFRTPKGNEFTVEDLATCTDAKSEPITDDDGNRKLRLHVHDHQIGRSYDVHYMSNDKVRRIERAKAAKK